MVALATGPSGGRVLLATGRPACPCYPSQRARPAWSVAGYEVETSKTMPNIGPFELIVILVILWLLGYFGRGRISAPALSGNWIHTLLVIVVILVVLRLLRLI